MMAILYWYCCVSLAHAFHPLHLRLVHTSASPVSPFMRYDENYRGGYDSGRSALRSGGSGGYGQQGYDYDGYGIEGFRRSSARGRGRGRGRGGGGRGGGRSRAGDINVGGSGYMRVEGDAAPIDEALVERLLTDRESLRRERRYEDADALRDEIAQMGVQIWDRDRLWAVGDAPPPRNEYNKANERGRENNFYRDTQRRAVSFDEARADPYSRDSRPRTKSRVRELNEFGHDYTRCEGDYSANLDAASVAAVNEMLRERLEAKLAKDFGEADALLAQLQSEYGVTVNDGSKQWRADGESFARRYQRLGPPDASVDEAAVQSLIELRTEFRKARNYPKADTVRSNSRPATRTFAQAHAKSYPHKRTHTL